MHQLPYPNAWYTGLNFTSDVTSDVSVEEPGGVISACLSCHVTFEDRAEQVAHYRLDWHRYNLKRRLRGLTHVTQAVFEAESGEAHMTIT